MNRTIIAYVFLVCALLLSCNNDVDDSLEFELASPGESIEIMNLFNERSFRQFNPSVDASPRKGVIISFYQYSDSIIRLWGQQSEGNFAIQEWEIEAADYTVYKATDVDVFKLEFIAPSITHTIPEDCVDCPGVSNVAIYIRQPRDENNLEFKLDKEMNLLSPYPVFTDWTKFNEDEMVESKI